MQSGNTLPVSLKSERPVHPGPSDSSARSLLLWTKMWSAPLQPRAKHFMRRLLHECLPLGSNLAHHGLR